MNAGTGGNLPPKITPNVLLKQIEREQLLRESKDSTRQVTQSVVKKFFEINGLSVESELDLQFFEKLEKVLDGGISPDELGIKLSSGDSAYKTRLKALLRAYKGTTGTLFRKLLSELISKSPMTKKEIARAANISVGSLHVLRMRNTLVGRNVDTIKLLDQALGADGQLILAYQLILTDSHIQNLLPSLTRPVSFGSLLKEHRTKLCLTRVDLAKQTGISQTRIRSWEESIGIPPLTARSELQALDKLLGCEGQLVELWMQEGPRTHFLQAEPYRLALSEWPDKAKSQWDAFLDFNTTNSQELPKETPTNWREASVEKVQETMERFFGFLHRFRSFPLAHISLLLLCDWSLFKSFLDFVRQRTGRPGFIHTDEMMVNHYRSWLSRYFRQFWKDAQEDEYWKNRLPSSWTVKREVGHGYFETETKMLTNVEQKWSVVVGDALAKSLSFLQSTTFTNGHFHRLAIPFIKSKTPLEKAATLLEEEVNKLPPKFERRAIVVRVRRLATSTLSLLRALRTGTLRRLLVEHVPVEGNIVSLDAPGTIVKNAKQIQGPLPNLPWAHRLLIRYIKEARPLLVGSGPDKKFLFTGKSGKALPSTAIYADVRRILGVGPHAMRYVVTTEGRRQGSSTDAMSKVLVNTPQMIAEVYEQTDAEDHNAIANQEVEKIFSNRKGK